MLDYIAPPAISRWTIIGRARLVYVQRLAHCSKQFGLKVSALDRKQIEWAVCDDNGIHSTHFVNWSTIISMCSLPRGVFGNHGDQYQSEIITNITRSMGAPA